MKKEHEQLIEAFALGEEHLRDQAIAIHRHYIPVDGVRGTPHQRFMAETDNPCPDLALRATYRRAITTHG